MRILFSKVSFTWSVRLVAIAIVAKTTFKPGIFEGLSSTALKNALLVALGFDVG